MAALREANECYEQDQMEALDEVTNLINEPVSFYPKHIDKEDNHFFFPILEYLTQGEQAAMLQEFWEFDRKLIHEKYQKVVEELLR